MEYGIVDECKVPCDMPFNLRRRWIFSVLFAFSHNLYSCQGKTGKLESRKTIELDDNNQHILIYLYLQHQRRDFEENLLIFSMESTSKESSKGSNFKQKKVYVGRAGTTFINRERKENLKRRTGTAFLSESGADKTNTVYEKGNTHIAKKVLTQCINSKS